MFCSEQTLGSHCWCKSKYDLAVGFLVFLLLLLVDCTLSTFENGHATLKRDRPMVGRTGSRPNIKISFVISSIIIHCFVLGFCFCEAGIFYQ